MKRKTLKLVAAIVVASISLTQSVFSGGKKKKEVMTVEQQKKFYSEQELLLKPTIGEIKAINEMFKVNKVTKKHGDELVDRVAKYFKRFENKEDQACFDDGGSKKVFQLPQFKSDILSFYESISFVAPNFYENCLKTDSGRNALNIFAIYFNASRKPGFFKRLLKSKKSIQKIVAKELKKIDKEKYKNVKPLVWDEKEKKFVVQKGFSTFQKFLFGGGIAAGTILAGLGIAAIVRYGFQKKSFREDRKGWFGLKRNKEEEVINPDETDETDESETDEADGDSEKKEADKSKKTKETNSDSSKKKAKKAKNSKKQKKQEIEPKTRKRSTSLPDIGTFKGKVAFFNHFHTKNQK